MAVSQAQDALRTRVRSLPTGPGVYLFRDEEGSVLYVGKAKSLRSRVRQHLSADLRASPRRGRLAQRIRDVETFVLESEAEALLLEWNLIGEHAPPFNVQLRDDKSYPYVKVTVQEPYPRVLVTRRLEEDGARYFGPFTDVGAMRSALRAIKRMYAVRSCHYDMPEELPARPCLDYHIGRCRAPCAGLQSREAYRATIEEILEILGGRTGRVRETTRTRMDEAAEALDFERAAQLRDVLRGLDALERRQTTVDFRGGDRDVLGLAVEGDLACGVVLQVREGRLVGRRVHYVANLGTGHGAPEETEPSAEALGVLVKGFYLREEAPPPELLVPAAFPDRALVEEYLAGRRDGPFAIAVPQRGRKRRLLELARRNAAHVLRQDREGRRGGADEVGSPEGGAGKDAPASGARTSDGPSRGDPPEAARRLAASLELPTPPRRLVAFDISTLGGSESVGSLVWLDDGRPLKDEYRRFRVREAAGDEPDDYAMMQEVVRRYFERRVREGAPLPDLVVVDGGRGQLSAAAQAMEAAGVSDLPLAALAKREEEVFLPGRRKPVRLHRADPGLHWLQRARDEAHRFALGYHRLLRRRRTLRSRLSDVPGVGPTREQELLRRFGSLDAVRAATPDELRRTPGIGPATAARIRRALGGSGEAG